MNEEPFILDFDLNKKAVIEPGVENLRDCQEVCVNNLSR